MNFDSKLNVQKLEGVRNTVIKQYGEPNTKIGDSLTGSFTYTWKLKDEVMLELSRYKPDAKIFLKYISSANYQAMEAERARQKQAKSLN